MQRISLAAATRGHLRAAAAEVRTALAEAQEALAANRWGPGLKMGSKNV